MKEIIKMITFTHQIEWFNKLWNRRVICTHCYHHRPTKRKNTNLNWNYIYWEGNNNKTCSWEQQQQQKSPLLAPAAIDPVVNTAILCGCCLNTALKFEMECFGDNAGWHNDNIIGSGGERDLPWPEQHGTSKASFASHFFEWYSFWYYHLSSIYAIKS